MNPLNQKLGRGGKKKPAPPMRPDVRDDRRRRAPPPHKPTYLEQQIAADAKRLRKRMAYDRSQGVGIQGP